MSNNTKLLLFDLDDTLLNSEKYVSSANIAAINKCKSLGMIIGYITAREPRKVPAFLRDLPCDCIAYYNGAFIYANDTLLERNEIPYTAGIKTISEIKNAYPEATIGVHLEPYKYFEGQIYNIVTHESKSTAIKDLPQYDIQRIRIVAETYKDVSFNHFITNNMNCFYFLNGSAVITSKNANKEYALHKFAEYFDVAIANIIAFGDDTNDIGMIKTAGIGVAMGNACDDIKSAADCICDTNDNDGVAKWINNFLAHQA